VKEAPAMAGLPNYFERAADALWLAMAAPCPAEENIQVEEALRLNSLALAEERSTLAKRGNIPPHRNVAGVGLEPIGLQGWISPLRH